jgi:hypothetical protein
MWFASCASLLLIHYKEKRITNATDRKVKGVAGQSSPEHSSNRQKDKDLLRFSHPGFAPPVR